MEFGAVEEQLHRLLVVVHHSWYRYFQGGFSAGYSGVECGVCVGGGDRRKQSVGGVHLWFKAREGGAKAEKRDS